MDKVMLFRRSIVALLAILVSTAVSPSFLSAQYGGVSGLFVTTSPTSPGFADFTGLGCAGGVEVVLYLPGIQPTTIDPPASQSVPGRILAVTTSVDSADSLENGIFAFPNVQLPTELGPGTYDVHSRCGNLDLSVLIRLSSDGSLSIDPDPDAPIVNGIPEALPFTGGNSSRLVSFASALVAVGLALAAYSHRTRPRQSR
jgi:hypothetical protein